MITCQEKLQKLRDNEKQLRVEDHEIRKVKVSCATNMLFGFHWTMLAYNILSCALY